VGVARDTLQVGRGRLGRAHLMREGPTTCFKASFHFLHMEGGANPHGGVRV
jgi:hypothetical protein